MPKKKPQRKSPHLQGYDYTQEGAYFVTICTHLRQHRFGEIINDEIALNPLGQIAYDEMTKLPSRRHFVDVDLAYFAIGLFLGTITPNRRLASFHCSPMCEYDSGRV